MKTLIWRRKEMWSNKSLVIVLLVLFVFSGGPAFAGCPSADLTGDCLVDLEDFAVFASQWLTEGEPYPVLNGMTWVSINDSGAGMEDVDGNPISHGGFTGEMGKYETTNAQYCEFLNAAGGLITVYNNVVYATSDTGHLEPYFDIYPGGSSYSQITYSGGVFSVRSRDSYSMANHPVVYVSWYGATAFCNYYGYRLPTEWEWQAVADHTVADPYIYGCGTTIDQTKANYYDNDYANPLGLSSVPYTSPVNHYSSYGYGMNDMAGNVWEWTSTVSGSFRVIRGGGWATGGYCVVSYRCDGYPDNSDCSLGFRACR
jgi:hypothetical protein